MPLICNEEAHTYIADEPESVWHRQRLLSVTDVIRLEGFNDPTWYTPDARERGKAVHRATHLWETVGLDEKSMQPEHLPFFLAWKAFVLDTGWFSESLEEPNWSPRIGVAGRVDRRGNLPTFPNIETLLDIKTGGIPNWTVIQLGGYCEILPVRPRRVMAVGLRADGTYSIETYKQTDLDDARRVFLAALACVRRKREMGILKEERT